MVHPIQQQGSAVDYLHCLSFSARQVGSTYCVFLRTIRSIDQGVDDRSTVCTPHIRTPHVEVLVTFCWRRRSRLQSEWDGDGREVVVGINYQQVL